MEILNLITLGSLISYLNCDLSERKVVVNEMLWLLTIMDDRHRLSMLYYMVHSKRLDRHSLLHENFDLKDKHNIN